MAEQKNTFRKLWLILWKNLILRKRHYIVTALEIILPTLFAILMAFIRARISGSDQMEPAYTPNKTTEDALIGYTRSTWESGYNPSEVGFMPNITVVRNFVTDELGPILTNNTDSNITWVGFDTDKEIEAYAAQGFDNTRAQLKFAIIINGLNENGEYPKGHKISYKLRIVDRFYDTTELMPWLTWGPGGNSGHYNYAGFSGLQIIVDKLLTKKLTGRDETYTISTQPFPYPEFPAFDFNQVYFILLPQLMVIGFIFIIPSIVRGIVSEKETGIKELMKMTGLSNWMHWVGWMLNSMSVLLISITIVIIIFFVTFNPQSGGVLKNSDPSVWWFVLFIYAIWATTYCFLISSVFERPTLATTMGIVLWLGTYYGVALPLEPRYNNQSLTSKLFLCLSPNMGLHYALKVLSAFEAKKGVGAQWKNMGDPISTEDSLALWHVLIMLLVTSVVYILLAMYLESVLPTKYGIRKPWYFIFMPSTWGFRSKPTLSNDISDLRANAMQEEGKKGIESAPNGLKIGMEILKLRKEFGKGKVAVNDVSLKVYEGQIFCLLGHNGAGKTTTMSILTGLMGPTNGTAIINGKDIRTEMDEIRQDLGLCPQHNLLFDKLTVAEHLQFFGMVKGLTSAEATAQVPELIRKIQLEEKANSLAMSLSGGQKRRLSLGCAIIGGSKVLFLDECSSGLDPEARRIIWDLLLEIRGERIIILTTHFLEEADVLGDRIAIMGAGKVQCCGSPMFLKKYYGTGYILSLSMAINGNPNLVLQTIQNHIPQAFVKNKTETDVIELTITLPAEDGSTSQFPAMFSDILSQKQLLRIQDIGISLTTMDEVFLKVEEQSILSENGNSTRINADIARSTESRVSGISLIFQQFWGLLLKKVLYSFRRWKLTLSQMIVPVLLLIGAILITNVSYEQKDRTPPLTMSLSSYKNQIVLYATDTDTQESQRIGDKYAELVGSRGKKLPTGTNLTIELLTIGANDEKTLVQRHIVAAELGRMDLNAMYSSIPAHSCPLSINLVTNTMLRYMDPNDNGYTLEVTNHPLSSGMREIFDAASPNPAFTEVAPFVVGVLVSIGLALLAASYIVMPIEERKCQAKQLQLITGVNPLVFWGSSFLWDYFLTLICVSVMVACLFIFEEYKGFTNNGGGDTAFVIMAVYGIGAIVFSYLLSLVAPTPAGGFALVTIIHIITGTGLALGVFILQDDISLVGSSKILGWIGRFFPTYGISKSLMVYTKTSTENSRCNVLTDDLKAILCRPDIPKILQSCCDNCQELGAECFKPQPYLVWSYSVSDPYSSSEIAQPSIPGIGQELMFMAIVSFVYAVILLLIEFGWMKKLLNTIWKQKEADFVTNVYDDDVQEETARVRSMAQAGDTLQDAVLVDNLCKSFGSFSAVSKLTFGVHHGECFGLLGVNGAGKTTSFRMLTGDEIISNGDAFINQYSLQTDRKTFLSRIGYCPQFDGIIGVLTGKEMLEIFARLRGINGSVVQKEAQKWLDRMGLLDSGNVQCQKYSGGMKRRLSAAMAMIGDPPIVLLDEPTSGVDPVSRRQFWNIISSLRDSGQSIILTSHSMEECEFLCSRLGIMVNGELQCLGRVQHLKNKFAQGYSLTIRLKPTAMMGQPEAFLSALLYQVTTLFSPCSLKDHYQNTMQFHIESTSMQWDELFKTMEDIKIQFAGFIEEYSIQQTTLEEVFLSFARKQYTDNQRQVHTSAFRKTISCIFGC